MLALPSERITIGVVSLVPVLAMLAVAEVTESAPRTGAFQLTVNDIDPLDGIVFTMADTETK